MNNAPRLIKSPVMSKFCHSCLWRCPKNFDFARLCYKEIQITRDMEASVVMKEDKKTKIKTFSAGYAQSNLAFFKKTALQSVVKHFFADSALQSAYSALQSVVKHFFCKKGFFYIEAPQNAE